MKKLLLVLAVTTAITSLHAQAVELENPVKGAECIAWGDARNYPNPDENEPHKRFLDDKTAFTAANVKDLDYKSDIKIRWYGFIKIEATDDYVVAVKSIGNGRSQAGFHVTMKDQSTTYNRNYVQSTHGSFGVNLEAGYHPITIWMDDNRNYKSTLAITIRKKSDFDDAAVAITPAKMFFDKPEK